MCLFCVYNEIIKFLFVHFACGHHWSLRRRAWVLSMHTLCAMICFTWLSTLVSKPCFFGVVCCITAIVINITRFSWFVKYVVKKSVVYLLCFHNDIVGVSVICFALHYMRHTLSLSYWYPGSGVVLDCIDSWSLHHYLLFLWKGSRFKELHPVRNGAWRICAFLDP